ncbi:hypothetical protein FJQ98_16540 [Lysinibacillus agricola]|uniref:Uncharacterized protein n=1 Tax=Lysinibacillus agricola TaxID=2590012 RepID=A0ABX7ALY7_9BACI|nr:MULTISPECIES: hypothetical protein [Lysinibacillus]QQP10854.1 hypothetical protein FJQ98_16540 [Lysinibacillus agricola]
MNIEIKQSELLSIMDGFNGLNSEVETTWNLLCRWNDIHKEANEKRMIESIERFKNK